MSNNFVIGSAPIGTSSPCQLTFHEFIIYDSINWNASGTITFNNTTKNFDLVPPPSTSGLYYYDATAKTYSTIPFVPGLLGGAVLYDKINKVLYTS